MRWFGHALRKPAEQLLNKFVRRIPEGRRPVGCPRQNWMKQKKELCEDKNVSWAQT